MEIKIKIGEHIFSDRDCLDHIIKIGLIKLYDLTPGERERHDEEMVFYNGVKIKCTTKELAEYWRKVLSLSAKVGKEIQPGEEVPNIWC